MTEPTSSNVFQLGSKRPMPAPPVSSEVPLVDQDENHTKVYSKVLEHSVVSKEPVEILQEIKVVRSAFLKTQTEEEVTSPLLVLKNKTTVCNKDGMLPTAELKGLWRRARATIDAYFGPGNEISSRLKADLDEFCMDMRRGLFEPVLVDDRTTAQQLADNSDIHFDIWISEFGVQTQAVIYMHFPRGPVSSVPRLKFFSFIQPKG